ncbi:MAG: response regulator transcription factor [Clostridiales bacterium]|nr:response regulator transcription factor [Clostridiales bacterium]
MSIRVLIADDNGHYLAALSRFLHEEGDMDIVGAVSDGERAVSAYEELRPDVVVMDVFMPKTNGIQATRQIHRRHPASRVVVLTGHEYPWLRGAAFEAGAAAFVTKHTAPGTLPAAIRDAASMDTPPGKHGTNNGIEPR